MFTDEQVLKALNEAVDKMGEGYEYEPPVDLDGCVYAGPDGEPSCLVGHVIARLNPDLFKDVVWWESEASRGGVAYLNADLHIFTPTQEHAMQIAQREQDYGMTWGYAAKLARDILGSKGE